MKIPTFLALVILSILIIAGITLKFYSEKSSIFTKDQPVPQNITQSNLSLDSISLSFYTPQAVNTQVIYSTNQNMLSSPKVAVDDRDSHATNRFFHFVTLQNLNSKTEYFYKIKIGSNNYPSQALSFTTPEENSAIVLNPTQPLIGSVIDSNLNPVNEALITLSAQNYLPLSTTSDFKGGFVLSLKPLFKKDDLRQFLNLPSNQDGQLIITKDNLTSTVDIRLNQLEKILPPIVLGQNLDLRDYTASPAAYLKEASPAAKPSSL
jgi:hypothetical protein